MTSRPEEIKPATRAAVTEDGLPVSGNNTYDSFPLRKFYTMK
jgi:hypothetical protein